MTTTVTTVTVSTVTVMGLTGALGLILTLTLLALLVTKEISSAADGERPIGWRRTLNIGLVPMLISFITIVAVRFSEAI